MMIGKEKKKEVLIGSKQIKHNIAEHLMILTCYESFKMIPDLACKFLFLVVVVVISLAIHISFLRTFSR